MTNRKVFLILGFVLILLAVIGFYFFQIQQERDAEIAKYKAIANKELQRARAAEEARKEQEQRKLAEERRWQAEIEARKTLERRERIEIKRRDKIKEQRKQEKAKKASQQRLIDGLPIFMKRIHFNKIKARVGIGGIALGDREPRVHNYLGEPDEKNNYENRRSYLYYYSQVWLGVYVNRKTRKVISFRLRDRNFNKNNLIPVTIGGITIGSHINELIKVFGKPRRTLVHFVSCSSSRKAIEYYYSGISFCICESNNRIYGIDIP